METKANFALIGAFTILGFLGLLAFLLWFAKLEMDRQFAYYDIYFNEVSGLGVSSEVTFAGLSVGKVVDMWIEDAPGQGDANRQSYYVTPVLYSTRGYAFFAAQNPDVPVFVAAPGTVEYQKVMDTMALVQAAGVPKVSLMSQPGGNAR